MCVYTYVSSLYATNYRALIVKEKCHERDISFLMAESRLS